MLRNIPITLVLFFLLLIGAAPLSAQSSGRVTAQQSSLWLWATAGVRVHRYFGVSAEAIIRLSDFRMSQQHEFHLAADLYVNDHLIITPLGYGYILNYAYGKLPAAVGQNEHRLWQQVVYRTDIRRVGLHIRLRTEENWKERKVKDADGQYYVKDYTFKPRLRTRFMVNIALNHKSMSVPKTVFLSVWDETYIALAPRLAYHLPEENRAHIGIGYKPTTWASVTMGYLHQLLIRNNGAQAESNHTLVVQATFAINTVKKKGK